MSISFLEGFPYSQAREIQKEALQTLQDNFEKYDVFVIVAPTAFGKSAVAKAVANATHSCSIITPTNLLVQQFLDEFPDTPTLSRLDSYRCEEWQRPCSVTRAKLAKFCKGCKCGKEIAQAKYKNGPGVYNYYTYLSHKLYRDILVVDEAHNLIPTIRDRMAITLWQHDYKYPDNMFRPDQILAWIDSLPDNKKKNKKIRLLRESASYQVPEYVFHRTLDWFNGKGTLRNEPEERDCIRLLPVDISQAPPMFWPGLGRAQAGTRAGGVQKLVLLSATIGQKDIEQMGLGKRRVCYIQCKSPIPRGSRPIIPLGKFSVNRQFINSLNNIEQLATYIQEIANYHKEEKGVIHVTYQLSRSLQAYLTDNRFIFHSRDTKSACYQRFRNSSGNDILVACGMYEGMDLVEDAGRWQIIAKTPWPSLASPAIKHLSELDPEWYAWETWKTLIQGCGRVCRTVSDYGCTYIIDKTFWRLYYEYGHLVPDWYKEAFIDEHGRKINWK